MSTMGLASISCKMIHRVPTASRARKCIVPAVFAVVQILHGVDFVPQSIYSLVWKPFETHKSLFMFTPALQKLSPVVKATIRHNYSSKYGRIRQRHCPQRRAIPFHGCNCHWRLRPALLLRSRLDSSQAQAVCSDFFRNHRDACCEKEAEALAGSCFEMFVSTQTLMSSSLLEASLPFPQP